MSEIAKTAWVLGASGFWGRNVTLCLLRQGWQVFALCRSQPQDLASWSAAQSQSLIWHPFDLNQPDLQNLPPTPTTYFHCASVWNPELAIMWQTNVQAPIQLIDHILPAMQATGRGRMGIFLGQNGRLGLPGLGSFSATQAALWTWAEAQSRSLKDSSTTLSLVFPPRAPSKLQAHLAQQLSQPPKIKRQPKAETLVAGVLAGHRRVGRWPWIAGLNTLTW
jgi:NAD(P)-dependent dehydrogenase (short-subunit alcohol dehydrogenase family)